MLVFIILQRSRYVRSAQLVFGTVCLKQLRCCHHEAGTAGTVSNIAASGVHGVTVAPCNPRFCVCEAAWLAGHGARLSE